MQYGLIGERLGHSFSAELHRCFGRYDYSLFELAPSELGDFLKRRDFAGLNVTIPYKQAMIPYLDRLDAQAAAIGAVNTVVNRGGLLWGYNTDFGGMEAALRRLISRTEAPVSSADGAAALAGKTALILGTGGTSQTALAVCKALGAAACFRVSRTGRAGALRYEEAAVRFGAAAPPGGGKLWMLNCTPAGMHPDLDGMPLDPADFPTLEGVFDCVYNPLRTRLVLAAQARGLPAGGGIEMLVQQAALACALFTGAPVTEGAVAALCASLLQGRENLVLIGMPGAGKTTVGRLLAQRLGREFADTDEMIAQRCGASVSTIFATHGEAHFRALEEAVVRELSASGAKVIATGGGTVLRENNVRRLRQNGRLYFLDRPPAALTPSEDRPLGDTGEKLRRLYAARLPLYRAAADCTISAPNSPAAAADAIVREWNGRGRREAE